MEPPDDINAELNATQPQQPEGGGAPAEDSVAAPDTQQEPVPKS
ncbi:hypothetical protein [Kibdelosporangium philippinense]|nr:hypothetical protein [Kibdelosporangium philippinense]